MYSKNCQNKIHNMIILRQSIPSNLQSLGNEITVRGNQCGN
jgi:hypothetical protein